MLEGHVLLTSPLRHDCHKIQTAWITAGLSWRMTLRGIWVRIQKMSSFRSDSSVHLLLTVHLRGLIKAQDSAAGNTIPVGQVPPAVWTLSPSALFWTQNYLHFAKEVCWKSELSTVPRHETQNACGDREVSGILCWWLAVFWQKLWLKLPTEFQVWGVPYLSL